MSSASVNDPILTLDMAQNINNETAAAAVTANGDAAADNSSDIIPMSALSKQNSNHHNTQNNTTATTVRPITPIPGRKLDQKRSPNLRIQTALAQNVNNSSGAYAETENATLSNAHDNNDNGSRSEKQQQSATADTASSSSTGSGSGSSSGSNTTFPYEYQQTTKKLDISFENISFTVKTGFFKREYKQILNGLTGQFRAGELSAILGPSGAGKSTFLNILSSYTPYGYSGDIKINDKLRVIKSFKPNVAFITQDTSLQPHLSVKEAMHFAANLKIGTHMSKSEKRERVRKILEAIGMYENRHTRTGKLSGGQKKRLAIALELVNNPPVLILDEPTSGLDSSTSNQCISLLKKLALEGRTIICTIHQPSALSFGMFDHLYAIAEGQCIYAGGSQNLVPFLAELDLHCPHSYNPADFLMEIATNDYGPVNHKLVEKIENGRNKNYRQTFEAKKVQLEALRKVEKMMELGKMTPVTSPAFTSFSLPGTPTSLQRPSSKHAKQLTPIKEMSSRIWESCGVLSDTEPTSNDNVPQSPTYDSNCCKPKKPKLQLDTGNLCKRENIYATPFYRQLGILLLRTFLILWRDSSLTTMRFVIHFLTSLLIGFLYYGIGNDAGNALNNFRYAFYAIMFVMYCAFSSILVKFPLEFPIVSREHFNRWYSLRAYYIAITLADIPIQLISTSLFIFPTYFLTDQPRELLRVTLFFFIVFMSALVAQSIGLTVGASLSIQLGAIFGNFFISPFLIFSGFFLRRIDCPTLLQWMFDISFLRYSMDGAMLALFGYNREKLVCKDIYCHYTRPAFLLKDLDFDHANYETAFIIMFLLLVGLRILAFYIMSFRLRLFR